MYDAMYEKSTKIKTGVNINKRVNELKPETVEFAIVINSV